LGGLFEWEKKYWNPFKSKFSGYSTKTKLICEALEALFYFEDEKPLCDWFRAVFV
jgi:hypothetical protein